VSTVFLSYSHRDASIARQVVNDLMNAGVNVWFDQFLSAGSTWTTEISNQLNEATAILVLISRNSLESQSVVHEWISAIQRSARVIPVLIGGATFSDLPLDLRGRQGIDLGVDYDAGLASIVKVTRDLARSTEPPVSESIDLPQLVEDVTKKVLESLGISQDQTLPPTMEPEDEKLVFVICSFLPDMEPAFEAISAAATSVGLRAERVKDVVGDYRITEKMLSMIRRAHFVVADLTHERPNVYFELGYARGIGKRVITILREGTERHFDIYDWTYLKYIDSRPLERLLIERFEHEMA
jgi:hypothetical protein